MKRTQKTEDLGVDFWYPLDNAAKIFPAITTDEVTSVFRIAARLKQPVNIGCLFKAVRAIEPRFPYYKVRLKRGFFWFYFESGEFLTRVKVDNRLPCRRFKRGGHLFRVLAKGNVLSVEFSHMLADGSGAFEYFTTLLVEYFERMGVQTPPDFAHVRIDEIPKPEEYEDAYNRYFQEDIPAARKRARAFHLPFPLRKKPRLDVLYAILSASTLKSKANQKEVSITVYLTAVYLWALQEIYESLPRGSKYRRQKKIGIEVPINLRNLYPSATLRNFSLFVMPEIDLRLGHYTFEEILHTVHHQMQLETDRKLVNKILAMNVGSERKLLVRSIPLCVKSMVLKAYYYAFGSSQYSGVLTNLGNKRLPDALAQHIDCLLLTPPPPNKLIKAGCGVISFNDTLVIGFCNITKSKELERRFVQFLVNEGVSVRISNNI